MNLLLFSKDELREGNYLGVVGDRMVHLRQVLKLGMGDQIRVGEINGAIGKGTVVDLRPGEILLEIQLEEKQLSEEGLSLNLVVALPRPQILKRVLQISGTFAVEKLTLIGAKRVEKSYFSSRVLREESLKRHFLLGMEQGVSTRLPKLEVQHSFWEFLARGQLKGASLLAEQTAEQNLFSLGEKLSGFFVKPLTLAIGPEGGWQSEEIQAFKRRGFQDFRLGAPVLRVDDALLAALSQLELLSATISQSKYVNC